MKFRNKKTGEIKAFGNLQVYAEAENSNESQFLGNFNSFKQIFEYYEDYIPKEPIIKDDRIRKAVKAWADENGYSLVKIGPNDGYVQIHFEGSDIVDEDKYGVHTITELCGEEG